MFRTRYQEGGMESPQGPDLQQLYQMLMQQGVLGEMSFEEFQQIPPESLQQLIAQVQGGQQQAPAMGDPSQMGDVPQPMMAYGGRKKLYAGGNPMINQYAPVDTETPEEFDVPQGEGQSFGQKYGNVIGMGASALGNIATNALADPDKSPTHMRNQVSNVASPALQGAMTGFATAGPVGAIVGGLGGLGMGLLNNSQELKAYRESEAQRQKPKNVGALGQSYNAQMAYGGSAERALVNQIKNRPDSTLSNNYSYGISTEATGAGKAGIEMNRPMYPNGGRRKFNRLMSEFFPGNQIERANVDIMSKLQMPLINNSKGSPVDEESQFGPDNELWQYQPSQPMNYRKANKVLRGMKRGQDVSGLYPAGSPAFNNEYTTPAIESPVGPGNNRVFEDRTRFADGGGDLFPRYHKRRFQKALQKADYDFDETNQFLMERGYPLTPNSEGFYTSDNSDRGNPQHPMFSYKPTRTPSWKDVNKDFRQTVLKGNNRPSTDFTNQRAMTRPESPVPPTNGSVFGDRTRSAYGGMRNPYGMGGRRGKC